MWELLGNVPIIRLNGFGAQLRAATFNGEANILLNLYCEVLELSWSSYPWPISANGANTN